MKVRRAEEGSGPHAARTLHRMFELPEYVQVVQLVESSTAAFPDIRQFWQQAGRAGFVAFLAVDMARTVDLPPQINPDWEFLANLFLNGIAGWYLSESTGCCLVEDLLCCGAEQDIDQRRLD